MSNLLNKIKTFSGILKYIYRENKKFTKSIEGYKFSKSEKIYLSEMKKNGFVVVENFFKKEKCTRIINKMDEIIRKYPNKIWCDEIFSDCRILGAEILNEDFLSFFNNNMIQKIGEAYCGFKLKNVMTMANKTSYVIKNAGSGAGWHKDAYRRQFKSLLYLNNVNSDNGAFELVKKSNTLLNVFKVSTKLNKSINNTRFSEDEINKTINQNKLKKIYGEAGTLILFDPSLIHRGSPLKNFTRYALTNYYESLKYYDDFVERIKVKKFNYD